ncbi:L-fuconate dehydratase [Ktedonospora formicarum]|uniref:L-fuconate dehydratase n=1 Tax=Ktedonospora formicarum TaxID=2778364 RepID=A0A8J3MP94_9CHLR|nr:L-fuconate dehydratase [Ktedonospora formicarum]GHO42685.1 L-fuconate dehydratase [Ktedonospora formicarum]
MPIKITAISVHDVRFPTSRALDGSDAMNKDPDYSAAYVILHTNHPNGLEGHGITFTIGRGNEVVVTAINALTPLLVGHELEEWTANMGAFWRMITGDSQLRWIGPEKGAIHLATAALVNAVWDLWAKVAEKPLWKLIADMTPTELVRCIDFRYITDLLTPEEALELLQRQEPGKEQREVELVRNGYPAYTTSAGWSGYSDEKMRALCQAALADGWTRFKLKVGVDPVDDLRRARIMREEIGAHNLMMMDANQVWEVDEAIERMRDLARFEPWWIEEPTSPDDVLGHAKIARAVKPIHVATGEHVQNRIVFKQLLQAEAISVCQIDACRLGGVNEVLAVLLMAAKCNVPVCPHAGGVGLCEYVQHLAMLDYIAISGTVEQRMLEYAAHLHEHFLHPVRLHQGHYLVPTAPGYSIEMHPQSLRDHSYPTGAVWAEAH